MTPPMTPPMTPLQLDDLRPEIADRVLVVKRADEAGAFDEIWSDFWYRRVDIAAAFRAMGRNTDRKVLDQNRNAYRDRIKERIEALLGAPIYPGLRSGTDVASFLDLFRDVYGHYPGSGEFGRPRIRR